MIRSEGSTIAAQLHVDDTYLPTNKQPPPSSAIDQPPLYDSIRGVLLFVLCVGVCGGLRSNATTLDRFKIGSKKKKGRTPTA